MPKAVTENPLTAALLTPPGEGGISVIALWGKGAGLLAAKRLKRRTRDEVHRFEPGRIYYGYFTDADGAALDEVVVACVAQDLIEINCHGGAVPARLLIKSLEDAGATIQKSRRPPGPTGGAADEAMAALLCASTGLAARVLAAQAGGLLDEALRCAARLIEGGDAGKARHLFESLLETHAIGAALVHPPVIAVVGPVNAGKSTLVNALAGFARTIVTDVPGTTRDAVRVPTALEGVPVILVDTAGATAVRTALEGKGAQMASRALEAADAVLYVYDTSVPLDEATFVPGGEGPRVIAANKADLAADPAYLEAMRRTGIPVVTTSGLTGEGMARLTEALLSALEIPTPPQDLAERPVVFTERQRARIAAAADKLDARRAADALAEIRLCLAGR